MLRVPASPRLRVFLPKALLLLAALLLGWTPVAYAQQPTGTPHGDLSLDLDCSACHRTDGWKPLRASIAFDHNQQTRFPLTGRHALTDCAGCHLDMRFDEPDVESNDCASCHVDVHQETFEDRCVDCHNTTAFQEVEGRAIHNQTRFPLTGAHAQISCESCHRTDVGGAFSVLDTECMTCHEGDYAAVHGETGFPTTCEACHTTLAWAATPPFDHASQAGGFVLLGAHETLECAACHSGPSFRPLFAPTGQDDCLTCHQPDFEQQHGGTGFSTACVDCHGVETWEGAVFDHALSADGFGLIGAHSGLDCGACHNPPPDFSPLFTPTDDTDCFACHQPDYQGEHADSGFPTTCQTCHTTDTWEGVVFGHASAANGFALVGAHDALDCSACHGPPPELTPLFTPTDQDDCLTCHQSDYQDEHANDGYPTTCLACHTTEDWEDATFEHTALSNGFALVGVHDGLDCSVCHGPPPELTPLFTPTDQDDCLTCHQSDYQEEHANDGYPTTCLVCHTTEAWEDATFEHAALASGFGLVGAHDDLDCSACHGPPPELTPLFTPTDQDDCLTCHQQDYQEEHANDGYPTACLDCHTTEDWDDATFEHTAVSNGFALVGAHDDLDCSTCHNPPPGFEPIFTPLDQDDCFTCHQPDYQEEHANDGYPTACLDCHTTEDWEDATFEHAALASGFGLVGAHDDLDCSACHGPLPDLTPLFSPTDQDDCFTCHERDYQDEHAGSGHPTTCLDCHNTEAWEDVTFEHASLASGFALVGAHDALDCSACHSPPPGFEPIFTPLDQDDCLTCHQPDFQTAHAGSGFPATCLDCHTTDTWEGIVFEHAAVSNGFGLVGAHGQLPCAACHNPPPGFEPIFTPLDQDDCFTCHQSDYQEEHSDDGYPTTCLACHNTEDWEDATFEHTAVSNGFALVGAHDALDCSACHGPPPGFEPLFSATGDEDCFACHEPDFQSAHAGSGFPTTCQSCHNTEDWEGATFEHAAVSNGFGLVGAHEQLPCAACHNPPPGFEPIFNPSSQDDCFTCHQSDYQEEHAGTGFPTTCLDCHNTEDWEDATFEHASVSNGFVLVGAHDDLDCSACHGPPPGFEPLFNPANQDDCFACHEPDFQSAHAGSGYPTTCLACHNNEAWEGATFEHAAVSNGFGLVGAHEQLPCLACHNPPPGFEPLFNPANQDDCFACHESDYQQEHAADGYPFDCLICHSVDTWSGATFNHTSASNGYPLVGAHDALPCSACHGPPPDLPPLFNPQNEDDCFTCHQDDYQEEHGGSGYPTTCLMCHNNDDWEDADFDHDSAFFPIFSGKHREEWQACTDCHIDPDDYSVFSCLTCHEHNQQDTDDDHDEVPGYVYESNACYSCHPNGDE